MTIRAGNRRSNPVGVASIFLAVSLQLFCYRTGFAQCQPIEVASFDSPVTTNLGSFGDSTAIDGDTLVVGDPSDFEMGLGAGAVFVFRRSSDSAKDWAWTAKLHAADAIHGTNFGKVLAVDGNILVVGSNLDSSLGIEEAGAAYVFERPDSTSDAWVQTAKLNASDPFRAAHFGQSVAVSGRTIVVGAPLAKSHGLRSGAVYVFEKNALPTGIQWKEVQRLLPGVGREGLEFGITLALSQDRLATGAPGDDTGAIQGGAVHVFGHRDGRWHLDALITAPDAAVNDRLGSVALSGNQLIAGAVADDDQGPSSGSAYIFTKNDLDWHFTQKVLPVFGEGGDNFGASLAAAGDLLIVTAPNSSALATDAGVAYAFGRSAEGTWLQSGALIPSELMAHDSMGRASVSDGIAVLELFTFPGGGRVHVFDTRLERAATTYCEPSTSGTSTCTPLIQATGNATASGTSSFVLRAARVPAGSLGYFFYTHAPTSLPVGDSAWTCLPGATLGRSQLLVGGGQAGCEGQLELDWNDLLAAQAGMDPALTEPGTYVYGQFAVLASGAPDRVQLTDAAAFVTCP